MVAIFMEKESYVLVAGGVNYFATIQVRCFFIKRISIINGYHVLFFLYLEFYSIPPRFAANRKRSRRQDNNLSTERNITVVKIK